MTGTEAAKAAKGPLAGLKVVEVGGVGPGPFCAMLLSDMGAEVVRIDRKHASESGLPVDRRFDVMFRGRRSLALDLKKPQAVEVVKHMARSADVLIEGFRPGVMERLGPEPELATDWRDLSRGKTCERAMEGTLYNRYYFIRESLMSFESPPHFKDGAQQLSGSVASYLREKIISGQLKPGDFLRIDAISMELNISTTPVREGLLLLQSESFVRLLPRRGFVVNSFNKEDLRDIFWAQAIVGAELAARATMKMSADDLAKLQELDAKHDQAFKAGDESHVHLGYEFHRFINLMARSPRLALLMGNLTKQLPIRFYAEIEGQVADTLKYHPIILDAMRMKDGEAVRSLMFRHIMSGAEKLIDSLERSGALGAATDEAAADLSDAQQERQAEEQPALRRRKARA